MVIVLLIVFGVFLILLSFLFGPLLGAFGQDEILSGIGWGLFAAAVFVIVFLLFRWMGIWKMLWAEPGRTTRPGVGTYSAAVPVICSPVESLWTFAKAVLALTAWFLCVGLAGYWMLRLAEAIALEGIADGVVSVLLGALWLALAILLGVRLECWADGERWGYWSGHSLAHERSDHTPDSGKA